MKRQFNFHGAIRGAMSVAFVMLVVAITSTFSFGSMAFAAAATGTAIGNIGETTTPDVHKVRDVSDALAILEPSRFPFDTMMRRLPGRRQKAKAIEIEWAATDRIPRKDLVRTTTTAGASGASVVVPVDHAEYWVKNDLINLPNNLTSLILFVEAVNTGTNEITVKALDATSFGVVPALTAGDTLSRIGPSKTESDTPSASRAMMPAYESNLIHTYDAVVEISDHRRRTQNFTATHDWKRARQDNLLDLRKSFEYNGFFGRKTETTDPVTGKKRWTQNGAVRYIPATINYTPGSLSESQLIDINKTIFTGNNGSATRMLFADGGLCTDIDKANLTKMQSAPTRVIAGVMFTEIRTRFGRLLVAYHPGFEELGYNNFGVVLDMNNVERRELAPMEKRQLRYKDSGQQDADAEQYTEKSSIALMKPDTHKIIQG